MDAPQGLIYYAGMQDFLYGSFTLTLGTQPSRARIYIPPQSNKLPEVGTLRLEYGGNRLDFPDARLMDAGFEVNDAGFETWWIEVADHRWRWQYGTISGEYNLRMDDQHFRKGTTKKNIPELLALCAEAMGEPKIDFSGVPSNQYPEAQWEYMRADHALDDLLSKVNFVIRPAAGNQYKAVPMAQGGDLPDGADNLTNSQGIKPASGPDSIRFVAGRTLYQHDFELEAVAQENNGDFVLLDKVSYKPKQGWDKVSLSDMGEVDPKSRERAMGSVFRDYRIKMPVKLPGLDEEITDLKRILPITDRQVRTAQFAGREETLPAWLWGQYDKEASDMLPNVKNLAGDNADPTKVSALYYLRGFSIDQERGIVRLGEHATNSRPFKYRGRVIPGKTQGPAILNLRTSVSVRDAKTNGWMHYVVTRKVGGQSFNTKPRDLVHDDISLAFWMEDGKLKSTQKTPPSGDRGVDDFAKVYLDAEERIMQTEFPLVRSWGGFKNITLDGAIMQVTWSVDPSGYARTTASRQTEYERISVPSLREMKFYRQADANNAAKAAEKKSGKRGRPDR